MRYRSSLLAGTAMRTCLSVGLLAISLAARSEISYKITARDGARLSVEMSVPSPGPDLTVQIPHWSPGAYVLREAGRTVEDIAATDGAGHSLKVAHPDDITWTVSGGVGMAKITYTVPMRMNAGATNLSGPSIYLYAVGRKDEPCALTIDVPSDWKIATGLDPADAGNTYTAPTYDVLADSPITLGDIRLATYTAFDRPHTIALYGAPKNDVNIDNLIKACKFVSEMEGDFFGEVPYKRYVWHFAVNDSPDGAGGLEHLNSTQISLASGVGPRAVGVLAHEFFHLWNVKRIRSKPLGPFDYTKLPKTGALWWLEGVTDYYAHTLLVRYGWDQRLYGDIASNYTAQHARDARLTISPYDSSYRVGEANNGIGNSNGYEVSYYDTGWLLGMLLDIEILSQTQGKHSLDDVELALWNLCKNNQPGFEEDEIRKQCVKFGGDSLGAFYDQTVMKPGELPVEQQLAKVGLRLTGKDVPSPDLGFSWLTSQTDVQVNTVHGGGEKLLKKGDVIVAINDTPIAGSSRRDLTASISKATSGLKPGDTITVKIKRDGQASEVRYIVGTATQRKFVVEEDPNASRTALRLRALWTSKHRNPR